MKLLLAILAGIGSVALILATGLVLVAVGASNTQMRKVG